MTDDIALRWRATKLDGAPPLDDDGCGYDGEADVGRVMKNPTAHTRANGRGR